MVIKEKYDTICKYVTRTRKLVSSHFSPLHEIKIKKKKKRKPRNDEVWKLLKNTQSIGLMAVRLGK